MAEDLQQKTTADLKLVKCNEATTMCPADIYYMTGREDDVNHNSTTASLPDEDNVLQVVEKGGVFFTLDNVRLGEVKRLYRQGKCPYVGVKQVPLTSLPQATQDMMLLPVPRKQKGRLNGKGPLKLLSFLHLDRRSSLTGARSTDEETTDEDTDRSDSECDWIATESK